MVAKLDRLTPAAQIAGPGGAATSLFINLWQRTMAAIEQRLTDLQSLIAGETQFNTLNVNGATVTTLGYFASGSDASHLTGTLGVTHGGTGATGASAARINLGVTATGLDTTYAFRGNNLSDLSNAVTARANLGLGALAVQNAVTVAQLPTPPTFSAYLSSAQSVASGSFAKVLFDATEWNVGSAFDAATNNRFTPAQAGKYLFTGAVSVSSASVINDLIVSLYKNGSEYKRATQIYQAVGGGVHSVPVDVIAAANGTTDYFEVFVFQDSGGSASLGTGAAFTWFQGAFVSP